MILSRRRDRDRDRDRSRSRSPKRRRRSRSRQRDRDAQKDRNDSKRSRSRESRDDNEQIDKETSEILKKEATTIRKVEIKSRNIDQSSDEESKSDRKRKRKKVRLVHHARCHQETFSCKVFEIVNSHHNNFGQ